MDYAAVVAWRYLRAKRRASVSVIGGIAIVGIMLGVGVLSAVLAVTSGFQTAFREKVLGVNAHLLVLKYGWDFTEYRDVITRVRPGVGTFFPGLQWPLPRDQWWNHRLPQHAGIELIGASVDAIERDLAATAVSTYLRMSANTN